jgi:hypothetical protein
MISSAIRVRSLCHLKKCRYVVFPWLFELLFALLNDGKSDNVSHDLSVF